MNSVVMRLFIFFFIICVATFTKQTTAADEDKLVSSTLLEAAGKYCTEYYVACILIYKKHIFIHTKTSSSDKAKGDAEGMRRAVQEGGNVDIQNVNGWYITLCIL